MRPLATVSIDVDPIDCYYSIHALGDAPKEFRDTILGASLPRYLELFAKHGISATFFMVGRDLDLDRVTNRELVRELIAKGHRIGNHSWSHFYDLAKKPDSEVESEISKAHDVLSELVGSPIKGFRAPGYDLSVAMLKTLESLGYVYDSSIFPAPGYYVAKAMVMASLKLRGRPSGAVMTNPRALVAPAVPYRPDSERPWQRGGSSVIELPVAVTPWARTPAIGTNMLLAPKFLRDHWIRAMAKRPHFNFELHGIDLCGADEDALPRELVAKQPDLKRRLSQKLEVLSDVLSEMSQRFEMTTMEHVAQQSFRS